MRLDFVTKLFSLDGKRAIVTGGNSGIGRGIAVSLASLGAEVAIIGRDEVSLAEVGEKLRDLGSGGRGFRVDLGDKGEIDTFFDRYYAENGGNLDILVANAGISYAKRALETTEEEADSLWGTNFKGTLFCCQRAVEGMKNQGGGNIVIVSSVNALYPLPPQAVYTSAKCAQEGLMQCLAVDCAKYQIRVNTVAPGAIVTNLGRNMPPPPKPRDPGERASHIPLGRVGLPEDIGDVVACMVSGAFRYMTGSTVLVDGGLRLRNV